MRKSISIDGVEVDISSVYSIAHQCKPGKCKADQSCCSKYEVYIDHREVSTIIGYLPEASKFASHLGNASDFENMFEEEGKNLFLIDTLEDDLCIFAYENKEDHILCSLHSAALNLKVHPHRLKPRSCVTWPLAISDEPPLLLSIADDAFKFPCNTLKKESTSLDPHIEKIIRDVFGVKFLSRLSQNVLPD